MTVSTAKAEATATGTQICMCACVCVSMGGYKVQVVVISKLPAYSRYLTDTFGSAMTDIVVQLHTPPTKHSPSPSLSKREKASLNSAICSSVSWSAMVSCRTTFGLKQVVNDDETTDRRIVVRRSRTGWRAGEKGRWHLTNRFAYNQHGSCGRIVKLFRTEDPSDSANSPHFKCLTSPAFVKVHVEKRRRGIFRAPSSLKSDCWREVCRRTNARENHVVFSSRCWFQ